MSNLTKDFKKHWSEAVWLEKLEGQTDEDIKIFEQEIRENWHDEDYRNSVCLWAKGRYEFRQELIQMGKRK